VEQLQHPINGTGDATFPTPGPKIFMILKMCAIIKYKWNLQGKREMPQCKNYQIFGQTENYCFKTPKYGEGHTANWKGCITQGVSFAQVATS